VGSGQIAIIFELGELWANLISIALEGRKWEWGYQNTLFEIEDGRVFL